MMLEPGTRVGSFEIAELLGSGGMGHVFRARDLRLGRDVAIKFLRDDLVESPLQLHRFQREARSASTLNHPNIVTIYEIGEHENRPYIAMEHIDGERLRDRLARGPLPLRLGVDVSLALADGLAAAHGHGIVHRDLKPENVMITRAGRIKILDFGLAKPHEAGDSGGSLRSETTPGVVIGTAGYMAPEQAAGMMADYRSDQFSLGAILYEMLAGRAPFKRSSTVETLAALLNDDPRPLSEVSPYASPELQAIISRCLAKSPEKRYASTSDLARDLRLVLGRLDDDSSVPTEGMTPIPLGRQSRRPMILAGVALLLAVVALALWLGLRPDAETPARSGETVSLPAVKYLIILPFKESSGDPEWQLIGEGMAETVSARLSRVRGLQVIFPSAVPANRSSDPRQLARSFGANIVLSALMRRSGERVRVTYSILDPVRGLQLAAGTVTGLATDLFSLEDQLAEAIAGSLSLSPDRERAPASLLAPQVQDRFLIAVGALQRYDDQASVDRAISILEPLADSNPRSALVQAALGRAYQSKYDLTSDPDWARKAVATSRTAAALDPGLPEVHVTLGKLLIMTGSFDEAIEELQTALELRPDDPEATLSLAEAHDRSGDHATAEETYRKAIASRPAYWAGYNKLGVSYLLTGRIDDAIPMLEKAAELSPENTRTLSNLGAAYLHRGDFDEGRAAFERAIAVSPSWQALSNLGTCLYYLGRWEGARDAFREATELAPSNYQLRINLGDAYRYTDEGAAALAAYREANRLALEALNLNSKDVMVHRALALIYLRTGDESRGRAHLDRALGLATPAAGTLFNAAIFANAAGRPDEALDWLRKAVHAGHGLAPIRSEPEFRNLRSREEFQRMVAGKSATAQSKS
ncbi:MAG TPA: tetratricopeptide repeat protein [Thermoanaerobaculia bacterium]|nr:tetratricopeptide repeat protein [Thermoanaerobaculia bacterium]